MRPQAESSRVHHRLHLSNVSPRDKKKIKKLEEVQEKNKVTAASDLEVRQDK